MLSDAFPRLEWNVPVLHDLHAFYAILLQKTPSELFSYATTARMKLIEEAFFFNTKVWNPMW